MRGHVSFLSPACPVSRSRVDKIVIHVFIVKNARTESYMHAYQNSSAVTIRGLWVRNHELPNTFVLCCELLTNVRAL